jgi:hypothetical protein
LEEDLTRLVNLRLSERLKALLKEVIVTGHYPLTIEMMQYDIAKGKML